MEYLFFFINLLQILTFGIFAYHFVISLLGLILKKKERFSYKHKKLAVIIAAHNEETVISATLKSIYKSNYPKELYKVFVVADNCTDNTANLAKQEDSIVWERENLNEKGKGYALSFAFQKLFSQTDNYDAVVLLDADNIVHENFLMEISKSLCRDCGAVQGFIDAKNPYSSWVSASYYITLLLLNTLYQSARHNIGFPVQLNGTGFGIKTDILKNIDWNADCLTEDIELTCKMILKGEKIAYNKNAVVYDEKPVSFQVSFNQRKRWMQGQSDVFFRYLGKLIKSAKNIHIIDEIIYLIQPFVFVLTGILTVFGIINAVFPDINLMYIPFKGTYMAVLYPVIQALYIPIYLFIINKLNKKTLKYYIPYLIFMYSWIPISVLGIINRKKKVWFHTKHFECKVN